MVKERYVITRMNNNGRVLYYAPTPNGEWVKEVMEAKYYRAREDAEDFLEDELMPYLKSQKEPDYSCEIHLEQLLIESEVVESYATH